MANQLLGMNYSDSTPPVVMSRDVYGRITNVTGNSAFPYSFTYVGGTPRISTETSGVNTNGDLANLERYYINGQQTTVNYQFYALPLGGMNSDSGTRWFDFSGQNGQLQQVQGIDTSNVLGSSGTTSTLSYRSGTDIISGIGTRHTFQEGTGPEVQQIRSLDGIGRLRRWETLVNGVPRAHTEYGYNSPNPHEVGLRKTAAMDRGDWDYDYNARGELVGGTKRIGAAMVPGFNYAYAFDAIGNRESSAANTIATSYSPNPLNQYSDRAVPAKIDIRGRIQPDPNLQPPTNLELLGVSVAVGENSSNPDVAPWENADVHASSGYFAKALALSPPANADHALWEKVWTQAWSRDLNGNEFQLPPESRRVFLPRHPEGYVYDFDGNLTQDGRWTYEWDGENRLVGMTARKDIAVWPSGELPPGMEVGRLKFTYDWMGRRIVKEVFDRDDLPLRRTRFVYDGWNLLCDAELHFGGANSGNAAIRRYVWGPDLSGTMAGAGGVGGLLSVSVTGLGLQESLVPAYDGNGNVMSYINVEFGTDAQEEEYGPFGEDLRPRRQSIRRSPIGWSTKYTDVETGLVYYGYRYYSPQLGRWTNRDPIEEAGGSNLYAFVANDPIEFVDVQGLSSWPLRAGRSPSPNSEEYYNDSRSRHTVNAYLGYYRDDEKKCDEIADKLYDRMKEFLDWSPNSVARLEKKGDIGIFTPGTGTQISGLGAGNSTGWHVRFSYVAKARRIQARTLGNHPLVGVRRWEIEAKLKGDCVCQIKIRTEAFERPRNLANKIGMALAGQSAQRQIWIEYFENVTQRMKADYGKEFLGSQKSEESFDAYNTGSQVNPWE